MSYSREQMIEAYMAGVREVGKEEFEKFKVSIHDDAVIYVDSLQDTKNLPAGPMLDQIVAEGEKLSGMAIFHRLEGLPELTAAISALSTVVRDARETDEDARGKSDLPESVPKDGLSLEWLDTTTREHILTSKAREVALAKILGGLLVKIPHGGLISVDWVLSEVERLNTYFPELDTES